MLLIDNAIVAGRACAGTSTAQITYSERGNVQGVQFYAIAATVCTEAVKRQLGREIPTD